MTVFVRVLTILMLLVLAVSALAQRSPRQQNHARLLDAVLKRNKDLKCSGTRVVVFRFKSRDNKISKRTRSEQIVRDGRRSRTAYFDDGTMNGQIAVDDGRFRLHYYPETKVIHQSPSLFNQSSERLDRMMRENRDELKIDIADGGKVAGRTTWLIIIKSPNGPEQKIWIDRKRNAILKRDSGTNREGRGMSYEFTEFKYLDVIDDKEFTIDKPEAKLLTPLNRLQNSARDLGYRLFQLKGAGKLILHGARVVERDSRKSLLSTYGDGRVILTLVQYTGKFEPERFKSGGGRRFQAYAWQKEGYNFALLGALPPPELKRLSKLVRQ